VCAENGESNWHVWEQDVYGSARVVVSVTVSVAVTMRVGRGLPRRPVLEGGV